MARRWLLVGYGNPLRGDDAAGQRVAETVAAWGWPALEVQVIHQLLPELAEQVAQARAVVFVDARVAAAGDGVQVVRLEPTAAATTLGHTCHPGELLALSAALYGKQPPCWCVTVPAVSFAFGAALSPTAAQGVADAVRQLAALFQEAPCTKWD